MELVEEGRSPPKRIKFQDIVENGKEDRFSALSDCLLIEVLSRLPSTKDAIRAGTLSKRCKHLWTLVPTLIFENYDDNHTWPPDFIDKTLTQRPQLKLKRFEVFTRYDGQYESHVNNWIRYAISCKVEELDVRFLNVKSEDKVLIDQNLFISSCFIDLTLEGCKLNPSGAISWKNLRSLCIIKENLDEDLIENILSGSPVLETLVLEYCYGFRRLDITSKSVKNLVLSGYSDPDDYFYLNDIIEINAPNILSLTIHNILMLWKVLLVNVSSLVEANLDYYKFSLLETTREETEEEMLKGFLLNLRHVKELKIGEFCSKVVSRLEAKGFNSPSNIKFPSDTSDCSDSESESKSESESEIEGDTNTNTNTNT